MADPVYRRSIGLAVEILGGSEAAAQYLGVDEEQVLGWLEGRAEPGPALLVRIVELVEKSTVAAARTATVVRSRRDEGGSD